MAGAWGAGELIVRREVLGLGPHGHRPTRPAWHGRPWEGVPVYVVEDTSDQVVTYLPEGAEIGFVESPDGSYVVKDLEVLDNRVTEGRFTSELVTWIRELGAQLCEQLDAGRQWWDPEWANWVPPADWRDAGLAADWSSIPCPSI